MVEGSIRVHMHLVNEVTVHMPLSLRDIVLSRDAEYGGSYTVTFRLPPDTSQLIRITRYWLVISRKTVLCKSRHKIVQFFRSESFTGHQISRASE